mmetsp:Transcript_72245/g.182770  ORF Transcript_72245/g.182770 Transcript_72245/m.182770 type:complete len:171 (+) Transcript_72245:101-613(+)
MAKFQLLAVLAAALAVARGSEVEPSTVEAALAADDQCSSEGEEGAICMLNALQLKAAKMDAESMAWLDGEGEGEGSTCTTGLVGMVYSQGGQACLDACPQACAPLAAALAAYMQQGGQPAARQEICKYQTEFSCALTASTYPKCAVLVTQAAGFGFQLPHSQSQLTSGCR